jgi:hypothetical protein
MLQRLSNPAPSKWTNSVSPPFKPKGAEVGRIHIVKNFAPGASRSISSISARTDEGPQRQLTLDKNSVAEDAHSIASEPEMHVQRDRPPISIPAVEHGSTAFTGWGSGSFPPDIGDFEVCLPSPSMALSAAAVTPMATHDAIYTKGVIV